MESEAEISGGSWQAVTPAGKPAPAQEKKPAEKKPPAKRTKK